LLSASIDSGIPYALNLTQHRSYYKYFSDSYFSTAYDYSAGELLTS
jgi:hypothetical protein